MDDDRTLISSVAARVAVPKAAPADSFVLHAPLELLARAALLPHVRPAERAAARERLWWLADEYDAAGDPVDEPTSISVASVEDAAARLIAALQAGDLDDVDCLAQWLGSRATASELRYLLAEAVAASLSAAAHASILLYLLPRVAGVPTSLLRGPARELARYPDWRLSWFEDPDEIVARPGTLAEALLDVPMLGLPGSNFIFPIMNQAEESGIAVKLLDGLCGPDVEVQAATRDLSRIAAWSMLQEPPEHAPYGWSHCLTMPQAVMGLAGHGAEPFTAVAVAATHVVGFRAALGKRPLNADYEPDQPTTGNLRDAIASGREAAASTVWHAPDQALDEITTELATRAALHHDAHLVKYTLACFDAAAADPAQRRLYLSAAASLSSWWAEQRTDGFFD